MSDQTIIRLLFARAEQALELLAHRFGARLLQTARNILSNLQDAEECVNDTYYAVWNAIPPREPDPLSGFVYKTGRNLALKRLRDNTAGKRDSRYDLSLEELSACIPDHAMEETISARQLGLAIDRFLDNLPRNSRVMFMRRYWFGDSIREIARNLGYSETAVSVRLNRVRNKLRTHLEQEGFFDDRKTAGCVVLH